MDSPILIIDLKELNDIKHESFYKIPVELMPQAIQIISKRGFQWLVNSQKLVYIF